MTEDMYLVITDCRKSFKKQFVEAMKLEIEIQEQELRDNYIEVIRLITGGFLSTQIAPPTPTLSLPT